MAMACTDFGCTAVIVQRLAKAISHVTQLDYIKIRLSPTIDFEVLAAITVVYTSAYPAVSVGNSLVSPDGGRVFITDASHQQAKERASNLNLRTLYGLRVEGASARGKVSIESVPRCSQQNAEVVMLGSSQSSSWQRTFRSRR